MNTKLDNITAQYRKFNENQALTEGQLNEFIDYFEDQDRLSRTRLSGTGIVCGFTTTSTFGIVNVQDGPNQNGLGISQGVGVTTDGDLITLRNNQDGIKDVSIDFDGKVFTHFKPYVDVYKYPHFSDLGSERLIELRNEDDILDGETGFQLLEPKTLNGNVVLLYLETYVKEGDDCDTIDCDNQGDEQISELRVLLASPADAEKIINGTQEDTIYNAHNEFEVLYDALPNIEVSRAFLTAEITTEAEVRAKFRNAIDRNNVVSDLNIGFKAISDAFNVNTGGLETLLLGLLNNTTETDFQYRYDLLKDLVATYNEIKNLLLHLKSECNPSIYSFPKHVMLGPVDAPLALGENTAYRHDFYKSPIITEEDENYAKAVLLTNRFVQKIEKFRKFIGSVRITPSKKDVDLGEKAVPFYYNVTGELLETWDYESTENDKEDHNLSYHKENLAGESFIQDPLSYNIDDNNFFRIEGHLGQSYKIAYENINSIKTTYGLPFDIKTIMLRKKSVVRGGPVRTLPTVELPTKDQPVEQPQILTRRVSAELTDVSEEVVDIQNDGRRSTPDPIEESIVEETTEISIADLRKQLLEVSDAFVSNAGADPQETLETIANLDYQLNLLNEVEALAEPSLPGGVTVVTQDSDDDEIESELLSDFMERHSGLEHFAGVEPGGTFILVHESEDKGQVIADFSLPYLCCSKEIPNIPPIALNDSVSALLGGTVNIPVLGNDYDPDNNPLTVVIKTQPSYGTIVVNSDETVTYTHDGSVNLEDSFTYCVNDGKDDSNIATVSIGVNSPPVALDDNVSTAIGGVINISVLDNDSDLGNTPLTTIIKTQPSNGTIVLNANGTVTYTHDGSDNLTDSFTYCVNDGTLDSNIATVSISIAPPPCDSGMDVVFILDYTGSMGTQIEAAKTGAANIVSTIQAQSSPNDYRLGLVLADEYRSGTSSNYANKPDYINLPAGQKYVNSGTGSAFQWVTAMEVMSTNNQSSFTTQLNKLNNSTTGLPLGSGVGGPEPTDVAISRVAEFNLAGAFRNDVARYIIMITDASPGGNDDTFNSTDINEINRLKQFCISNSIKVIVLGNGVTKQLSGVFPWKNLATGTGGSWSTSYDATTIQSEIINGCSS